MYYDILYYAIIYYVVLADTRIYYKIFACSRICMIYYNVLSYWAVTSLLVALLCGMRAWFTAAAEHKSWPCCQHPDVNSLSLMERSCSCSRGFFKTRVFKNPLFFYASPPLHVTFKNHGARKEIIPSLSLLSSPRNCRAATAFVVGTP